jgi:hypothetical protein
MLLCTQAAKTQAENDLLEGSARFHVEVGVLKCHILEQREMVEVAQVSPHCTIWIQA